ncbi:Uma2 family endonuclease [Salmonirosea aquatica]|uniref:Uncharacterized protein n=1 Tax=Salmonirosea aquatica TaxID=2654236 RepID=A0A7C9FY86_9BACT|nr:hypothetical protein [Cytophagaceae bacterium SJW1-29]
MEAITGQIPETLLYEEFGGRKYYRRGYRQILLGLKNESEIMGSSVFQSLIVSALIFYLKTILPKNHYWVQSSEAGLHLDRAENLANDIAIVEKSKLKDPRSLKYNDVPPRFVIEVDIKIDPRDYSAEPAVGSDMDYILQKSEQLLKFGVEGIAWILTPSRKTLLMRPNHRLEVYNWTDEVPLFGEYAFCLQRILEEEGILPESE